MSNYVYEEVVPFTIKDVGYYIPAIKQGVPTNINTLAEGNGGYDPEPDPEPILLTIGGILFTVDKSIWNSYKNTISGSDFNINILLASNNSTYISNLNFSSITCVFGEEYENIKYVTLLGKFNGNNTRYFPTVNTSIEITYLPTNTTFNRENIPVKTAGSRVIGRHVNWEGSVINFDQYGTKTNLYIPDAKFRNISPKQISSSSNGMDIQLHSPILKYDASIYFFDSNKSETQPFTNTEFLTDTDLQTKLDSMLVDAYAGTFNADFTAQEGTDAILLNLDAESPAALAARDVIPTGLIGCNLPNIYELSIIWLESDNIDLIDITATEHSSLRLGSPRRFYIEYFWSCTEVQDGNDFGALYVTSYGSIDYYQFRNGSRFVLPVLEL